MSILRIGLLLVFATAISTHSLCETQEEIDLIDECDDGVVDVDAYVDEVYDYDADDTSIIRGAAAQTVIWRGPQSYKGHSKNPQVKPTMITQQQAVQQHAAIKPQGRSLSQPMPPIHNKARKNDRRYLDGLNDLAGMM